MMIEQFCRVTLYAKQIKGDHTSQFEEKPLSDRSSNREHYMLTFLENTKFQEASTQQTVESVLTLSLLETNFWTDIMLA